MAFPPPSVWLCYSFRYSYNHLFGLLSVLVAPSSPCWFNFMFWSCRPRFQSQHYIKQDTQKSVTPFRIPSYSLHHPLLEETNYCFLFNIFEFLFGQISGYMHVFLLLPLTQKVAYHICYSTVWLFHLRISLGNYSIPVHRDLSLLSLQIQIAPLWVFIIV